MTVFNYTISTFAHNITAKSPKRQPKRRRTPSCAMLHDTHDNNKNARKERSKPANNKKGCNLC